MDDIDVPTVTLTTDLDSSAERLVIKLAGEIDMATVAPLVRTLDAVDEQVTTSVVVDLDEVTFIDSSGLQTLLLGHDELAERGIDLIVRNPQPQAVRLFTITCTEDILLERHHAS
jgi:anti-anti-sigma factor